MSTDRSSGRAIPTARSGSLASATPLCGTTWFWHPNARGQDHPLAELVEMYYNSVGRGCNLILNANIDRDGLVPEADMKRLQGVRRRDSAAFWA